MNKLYIIIILLILSTKLYSFELSNDKWFGDDKIAHCMGSFVLTEQIDHFTKLSPVQSGAVTIALGVLWEIKDCAFPYQKYGAWGGDNFSTKDLAWDTVGILSYIVFDKIKPNKKIDIKITCNKQEKVLSFNIKL